MLSLNLLLTACGLDIGATTPAPVPTATPDPKLARFKGAIIIGGIFDMSGASAPEGKEYAAGVQSFVEWYNSQGGAEGYRLDLRSADFGFKAPVAIEQYQRLKGEGAVAFISWQTADTQALTRLLDKGKTPLLSASYAPDLVQDTKKNPYNFMIAPTYVEQIQTAVEYTRVHTVDPVPRKSRVAFLYSDDAVGRMALQPGRDYASSHEVVWFHEGLLKPDDLTTVEYEVKRLNAALPDYTYVQADQNMMAEVLKERNRRATETRFIGLGNTNGAELVQTLGQAANGFTGVQLFALPSDSGPGLQTIKRIRPEPTSRFIQGWATAQVLAEGVRRAVLTAGKDASVTGDSIRLALESLNDYSTGGLTPPITFGPNRHSNPTMRLFRANDGVWEALTPYISAADLSTEPTIIPPSPTPKPPEPTPTKPTRPEPTIIKTPPTPTSKSNR